MGQRGTQGACRPYESLQSEINRALEIITPVEETEGYLFKRDDLLRLQDDATIRGGKLRQCLLLLKASPASRLISAGSIHSPQIAIVAYVAKHFGLACTVLVGGKRDTDPVQLARHSGAEVLRCPSGRHTVLYHIARRMADQQDLIIPFGMRPATPSRAFYATCARQIQNVPEHIKRIVVATGSGVTATALAFGLWQWQRSGVRLALVGIGPDRSLQIQRTLNALDERAATWALREDIFEFHRLGQSATFRYEAPAPFQIGCVDLHPLYEGKAFRWYKNHVDFDPKATLFWVVGPPLQPASNLT